jgi:hypothetical protein
LRENGIAEDRYIAVNAAATGKPGDCWFEIGNPQGWYGQSVRSDPEAREQGVQLRRTKGMTIDGVLELLSPLDYMHMDIQGAELDFSPTGRSCSMRRSTSLTSTPIQQKSKSGCASSLIDLAGSASTMCDWARSIGSGS